jgi:hypothetical protein
LSRIQKISENDASAENANDSSKSRKAHKLIQNPAFETNQDIDEAFSCNGLLICGETSKHVLSEQKYLLKSSSEKNERRLVNRKKILKERNKFIAKKDENSKKVKLAIDVENNSNEDDSSDESSSIDDYFEENYMFKNDSDMENDIELLDPSDSLDQTMFNLIKAKKLNDFNKLDSKKLTLKRNSETNELLLVDYGDNDEEVHLTDEQMLDTETSSNTIDTIKAVPNKKALNKLIDKNVEYDYDHLLR